MAHLNHACTHNKNIAWADASWSKNQQANT
jgi:hypothetical protein